MAGSGTDVEDVANEEVADPVPPSRASRSRRRTGYVAALFALLVLLLLSAVVVLIAQGSIAIPISEVLAILTGQGAESEINQTIVMDARLPKVVAGLLAGAALAVCGAQMQTLFRNPLAEPFVLGVSYGAILGAADRHPGHQRCRLAVWTRRGQPTRGDRGRRRRGRRRSCSSCSGVSRRVGDPIVVLVVGVMLCYLARAGVDMLVYYTDPERLAALTTFERGSVRNVTWNELQVIGVNLRCCPGVVGVPGPAAERPAAR